MLATALGETDAPHTIRAASFMRSVRRGSASLLCIWLTKALRWNSGGGNFTSQPAKLQHVQPRHRAG